MFWSIFSFLIFFSLDQRSCFLTLTCSSLSVAITDQCAFVFNYKFFQFVFAIAKHVACDWANSKIDHFQFRFWPGSFLICYSLPLRRVEFVMLCTALEMDSVFYGFFFLSFFTLSSDPICCWFDLWFQCQVTNQHRWVDVNISAQIPPPCLNDWCKFDWLHWRQDFFFFFIKLFCAASIFTSNVVWLGPASLVDLLVSE